MWTLLLVPCAAIALACGSGSSDDNGKAAPTAATAPSNHKAPNKPAKKLTVAQENAVESAANYLSTSGFSRSGLIKQLKFEGFSTADATYGVDHQPGGVNWNNEAVESAKNYLDTGSFSHSGLVKQLKFEGYTTEQAEYGTKKAGL